MGEMAAMSEVRITDPGTGGEKGQKLERFDLLPVAPLEAVARHYGIGANKYAERNWEQGYGRSGAARTSTRRRTARTSRPSSSTRSRSWSSAGPIARKTTG